MPDGPDADESESGKRSLAASEAAVCVALGLCAASLIGGMGVVIPRLPVAVGVPVLVLDVFLTTKVLMPHLSRYVNGLADNTTPHVWLLVLLGPLVPVAVALRL